MTVARKELVTLNPPEVATADRIEIDLHSGAIQVREGGPDWGDTALEMFMAERTMGSVPIDNRLPNRVIAIPLILGATGDFDAARIALQAECSRINEDGGWLKRQIIGGSYGEAGDHLFCDLVKATLKLTDDTFVASDGLDPNAELILEALPDFYGDEEVEKAFEGTGDTSGTFQIKGNLPGRVTSLTVEDKSGNDQLGLAWAFRCKNYSADESAAWAYEAEDLTPLDLAEIATLSEASPSGSSANNAVLHNNLSTNWTPVLSTNRLPKVRAVAAAKASTGAITPALPTSVKENDILVMFIETENQVVTVPTGWAHVSGSPVEVASGTTTRLTVLWKRAGASETAPEVADPGDHIIARIMAVSGCIKTGNPWDVKATGTELVSDTSVAVPGATTTVDGCLVVTAFATGTDVSSSAHASAWTNANLQALTEQMDSWTAEGGGGGFGVATGIKLTAGAYGETTATVGTANFKALMSFALKPETGGNSLKHVGLHDVWARVYTTSAEPPWLRLVWDVGDLVAPSENTQVRIPGSNSFYLVNLGQVNIGQAPFGEHRWQAAVQAYGAAGGENVKVDRVWFVCGDEGSGVLRGSLAPEVSLKGFSSRDPFNQAKGALNGNALPDGSGSWATSGSTMGDFQLTGKGSVVREAKEDPTTRNAKASGISYSRGAMRLTFEWSSLPTEKNTSISSELAFNGVSILAAYYGVNADGSVTSTLSCIGDLITYQWKSGVPYKLILLSVGGQFAAGWITLDGNPSGDPHVVGPITGKSGAAEFRDSYNGKLTISRIYDDLTAWVPAPDMLAFANRKANLSTQGMFRQSEDGLGSGPIAYPGADLPRIPVSGPEERPVEIALKPSRGDFGNIPDLGLDKAAAQLAYRPCWSGVPGS